MARRPRTPAQKRASVALLAVSLVVIAIAERDLHRRPAAEVRGDKRLWRLACLNALGAIAYFIWGRRPAGV